MNKIWEYVKNINYIGWVGHLCIGIGMVGLFVITQALPLALKVIPWVSVIIIIHGIRHIITDIQTKKFMRIIACIITIPALFYITYTLYLLHIT